ncbi:pterin binding enzyme family protein, partial [Vibrio parahaemolyticus V-223/04]
LVVSPD